MKTARLFDTRSSWPRKAQSALLRCSLAPQPRSTATALSMPLGGNHSGTQSNSSRCKPGPRHMVHHRSPGLQRMPPRAA